MKHHVTMTITIEIDAVDEDDAAELASAWGPLLNPRVVEVSPFKVKKLRHDKALELLQEGHTYVHVAEQVGVSDSTVKNNFPGYGQKSEHYWWKPKAKEMLEDGMSYREVSRTLGIDNRQVARIFPGYGFSTEETQMVRQANAKLKAMGL